jgi:hypothetical protein
VPLHASPVLVTTLAGWIGVLLTADALPSSVGRREEAQQHLATAATMYGEMDMPYWREQAEVELRGLG